MPPIVLNGMTWQHRRAIEPLVGTLPAFRARHPTIDVRWQARPLSGFEFTPVEELAAEYDLIVLDHPFAGDVAHSRCLLPLDDLVAPADAGLFVGPSLETYRYDGRLWALPVDAATQVAAYRPDLMARLGAAPPGSWDDMFALGERSRQHGLRLVIALKGVHALMTFFTLCASQGRPCAVEPDRPFVEAEAAGRSLAAMRRLLEFCPPEALDWNSIALHEAMASRDDLLFCPAVYCYATYAESDNRKPLRFADLPGLLAPTPAGSTIGGTGIGISARCREPEAALAYVAYLMRPDTQIAFAAHHGQPGRIEAWRDAGLDGRFGGCFSRTMRTMVAAWTRPRYLGYLRFQAAAGDLVEAHLRGGVAEAKLLRQLAALHGAAAAPPATRSR